jgi:Fe-Mn family superoxide dismutase
MEWYELPMLPYDYDALEPHIDRKTLETHHTKHHQAYVNGANEALLELARARNADDFTSIRRWERDMSFNVSGHINHCVYWESMSPDGGGVPNGALLGRIKRDFGSYEAFKAHFSAAANSLQGNGWVLLSWDTYGKLLLVIASESHENRAVRGAVPLMALDLWEHAYYLKYHNDRAAYVRAWWNLVDWKAVAKKFRRIEKDPEVKGTAEE